VHGLKNSSRRRFGLAFEIARNSSLSLHLIQLISIGGTSQSDIARQPGLGEVEHRHLAHVGPRIRLAVRAADRAAILLRDVIRSHTAVAAPAVEACDEFVLALGLQHARQGSSTGIVEKLPQWLGP
jgi:hypothetical protein